MTRNELIFKATFIIWSKKVNYSIFKNFKTVKEYNNYVNNKLFFLSAEEFNILKEYKEVSLNGYEKIQQ